MIYNYKHAFVFIILGSTEQSKKNIWEGLKLGPDFAINYILEDLEWVGLGTGGTSESRYSHLQHEQPYSAGSVCPHDSGNL